VVELLETALHQAPDDVRIFWGRLGTERPSGDRKMRRVQLHRRLTLRSLVRIPQ
jgi:hypothetical protein